MKGLFTFTLLIALVSLTFARTPLTSRAHPCAFQGTCGIHDFQRVARSNPEDMHQVLFVMRQNNFQQSCGSMLMNIADPESPNYGEYLSFDQIRELVFDREAVESTVQFLSQFDVKIDVAPNGDFITVVGTVSEMERIFSMELHTFNSESKNTQIKRANSIVFPSALNAFVNAHSGLIDFPMYKHNSMVHGVQIDATQDSGKVTPQVIFKTYRMPNETDSTPKADQALFESLGQSYSPADLTAFQNNFKLPLEKIAKVIGPNDPSQCTANPNNCAEANLDVQYMMGVSQGSPTTFWSIPGQGDIFLEFAQAVAKNPNAPQVYSISYGGPEHLNIQSTMLAFNTEVCKMGLRGFTVFVSSGDDGVAGYTARNDPGQCGFFPQYPANCPYVTTVGATQGPESNKPEITCQSDKGGVITSGGGFSNVFAQPSYQTAAVSNYLKTADKLPPTSHFNTTGRAYPDVASMGFNYLVFIGGSIYPLSGTSASSPVFAAMTVLANGDREVIGKKPLGWLNPVLYSDKMSKAYNDVTVGYNNCCASYNNPTCCTYGFPASKGWDATTGWGSIDAKIYDVVIRDLP